MVVSLERERRFRPVASRYLKLSPLDFIPLLTEDGFSPRKGISCSSLVGVPVARLVSRGEKTGLTPNIQPGGPECCFVWPLSRRPFRHAWTCQEHKATAGTALGDRKGTQVPPRQSGAQGEECLPLRLQNFGKTSNLVFSNDTKYVWFGTFAVS